MKVVGILSLTNSKMAYAIPEATLFKFNEGDAILSSSEKV